MVKSNKNLKLFKNSKTKKNKGGQHLSHTYSLDSLETEEQTFLGLTYKNWAVGIMCLGIIGYNIHFNKQMMDFNSKKNFTVYQV